METAELLNQIKRSVLEKQSVLGNIYKQFGQVSLADYVSNWNIGPTDNNLFFKAFLQAAQDAALAVYGTELASKIAGQLKQAPLVSTIDHHGILNHPFFINSNLIFSLKKDIKYLICLSTSGVSLNNSSWPGCLLLAGPDGRLKRFSFFSDSQKTKAVWAVPALEIGRVKKIHSAVMASSLPQEQKARVIEIVSNLIPAGFQNFSQQASAASTKLWSKVFPSAPKVFYLPIEEITARMLKLLLTSQNSFLNKLLFSPTDWEFLEKNFQGAMGAFSGINKGSFLFWGVDSKGHRVRLARQANKLVGQNFSLEISPKAIGQALDLRQLYPSSLVCFMVLLLAGVTCLGGFNQVNWLSNIKNKFISLLSELGERELSERVSKSQTQNFAEANLAFLGLGSSLIKPTGLDLYLKNDPLLYQKYHNLGNILTLAESIESLLPEIYRVITPAAERNSTLLGLTDEMVLVHNGTDKKIYQALS